MNDTFGASPKLLSESCFWETRMAGGLNEELRRVLRLRVGCIELLYLPLVGSDVSAVDSCTTFTGTKYDSL